MAARIGVDDVGHLRLDLGKVVIRRVEGPLAQRRVPPGDDDPVEPLIRMGTGETHSPVGAHGGRHGRGTRGSSPVVVHNTAFGRAEDVDIAIIDQAGEDGDRADGTVRLLACLASARPPSTTRRKSKPYDDPGGAS